MMKTGRLRKPRLTRLQKIIRNLVLVAVVIAGAGYYRIADGSYLTEQAAVERALYLAGIHEEQITIDYRWHGSEEKYCWRECFAETDVGEFPCTIRFTVVREGIFKYSIGSMQVAYDPPPGRSEKNFNMTGYCMMEFDSEIIMGINPDAAPHALFGYVWDFPQLGGENVMRISNLEEDGLWKMEIDCLGTDVMDFERNARYGLFQPELVYTVEKESGTVSWMQADERCLERGMTLNDEEAVDLAYRLAVNSRLKMLDDKNVQE